jgi:Tfp pilus assembly protein PilX
MRQRIRNEAGFTLITALLTLFVLAGIGMGLVALTNSQQHAALTEQASETSFNVAEAALNAQIGQVSRSWPATESLEVPSVCNASTTSSTNDCPSAESLSVGYPNPGGTPARCASTKEAWGSTLGSNEWTTYVRDDGPTGGSASTIYDSSAVKGYKSWDANGDNKVWVRSVGFVQCRQITLLALAAAQYTTIPFPEAAVSGNWFEVTNSGKKTVVNTQGEAAVSGGISMRCAGTFETKHGACEEYEKPPKEQVKPETKTATPTPNPALTSEQLTAIKNAAKSGGHYFKKGECPSELASLSGNPVFVEGPCTLSYTGGLGNSSSSFGFLVIEEGTFELNGGGEFYGTVYAVNKQKSSGVVVAVHGAARLIGSIVVDGNAGISLGSSGKEEYENFVYSPNGFKNLKTFAGAAATRNSFRTLSNSE